MRAVILLAAIALAGCSTLTAERAPDCHGAVRPANPNGSVLASTAPPAAALSPASPSFSSGCGEARR